jgi:hypothetical protein
MRRRSKGWPGPDATALKPLRDHAQEQERLAGLVAAGALTLVDTRAVAAGQIRALPAENDTFPAGVELAVGTPGRCDPNGRRLGMCRKPVFGRTGTVI